MKTNLLSFILLSTTLFSSTCSIAEENKTKKDEVHLWDKKLYALTGCSVIVSSMLLTMLFTRTPISHNGNNRYIDDSIGTFFGIYFGSLIGFIPTLFVLTHNAKYKSKSMYLEAKKLEQELTINKEAFDQEKSYNIETATESI